MDEKILNEDEFLKELSDLLKKYNLKSCIFAGNNEENKMIGFFCIEKYGEACSIKDNILAYTNAARMYQSAREKIMITFDKM